MRFLLTNHIENARQSLRSNRMRSYLTMLGVAIGVASIVTILALSAGASKVVGDQVDALGGNIAVIRPGASNQNDKLPNLTNIKTEPKYSASSLTEYDLKIIKSTDHVKQAAPIMLVSNVVKAYGDTVKDSVVVATTPDLATISDLPVREGQFLDDAVNLNTAVIGTQLSINAFGTEHPIGKVLTVRGQSFTVIGVLKRLNNPINYNLIDFDKAAIINIDSAKKLSEAGPQIQQINVRSDSIGNLNQAIIDINKALLISHKGENDFSVLTGDQIAQPTSQLFFAIAGATTAVAAISLLVGGIGIMNIMLVNVAERTREIGIRKALGANNSDIASQFIIESLAIGLGGGLAGYGLGYLVAFAISRFLTFDPIINWQIAAVALFISLVMGTIFGIYPALRAARKDPIDSLREYS